MGSDQHYSLRWNDYTVKIVTAFQSLRDEEDFVDVTVACDGHSYSAHKMVLSACSPYFRVLLRANPCQHPIVILKDVGHTEMERLLEFMYNGEVSIAQDQLAAFLKTAENLKIRGLAGNSDDMEQFQRADISYNYNSRCSMGGGGTSGRSSPSVSYAPSQASKDDELTTDVPSGYLSRNPDSPPSKRRKRSSAPAASHSDANAASHSKECVVSESGVEVSGSSASDGCGIVGAQGSGPNDSDDPRQECRELKTEPQDPILDVYAEGPDLGSDPQGQQHQTGDPLDTRSSVMYPLAMPGPSGTLGGQDTSQEPGGVNVEERLEIEQHEVFGNFSLSKVEKTELTDSEWGLNQSLNYIEEDLPLAEHTFSQNMPESTQNNHAALRDEWTYNTTAQEDSNWRQPLITETFSLSKLRVSDNVQRDLPSSDSEWSDANINSDDSDDDPDFLAVNSNAVLEKLHKAQKQALTLDRLTGKSSSALRHSHTDIVTRSSSMGIQINSDNTEEDIVEPEVDDIAHQERVEEIGEEMEVREETEEVQLQGNPELYTKLKDRLIWNEVPENNHRAVPVWLGEAPFVPKVLQPIEYYRKFMDEEILQLICNESNRYCLQNNIDKLLCLEPEELEKFIGISFYMSLVKLPSTRYYWQSDLNIPAVSHFMPMRRWETIKSNLHFSDNEKMPGKEDPAYDRLFKIRPFLDILNSRFNAIPMGEMLSIDEQMIPYSGTRGPRCYVKGKPNPWGFKAWVLADTTGIVYNTYLCAGSTPRQEGHPNIGSTANTVLKLAKLIPDHQNFKLTMDSYFSTIPLFYELFARGIFCLGNVRLQRVSGIKSIIMSDEEIKAMGRSSFMEYEAQLNKEGNKDIRVVRWQDNAFISLMYTYGSAYPAGTVQRWNRSKETGSTKVTVKCPSIVKLYNSHIGGIDKMDSLLGFYRMFFRSRKWYHRIFFHFVDEALINAWLLYKRDFNSYHTRGTSTESMGKIYSLYEFKADVSYVLRTQCSPLKKRPGSPSTSEPSVRPCDNTNTKGYHTKIPRKVEIENSQGHIAVGTTKRGMCAVKKCYARPVYYCLKCSVHLCISSKHNCFATFHGIDLDSAEFPH